jgi:hypothetical protein
VPKYKPVYKFQDTFILFFSKYNLIFFAKYNLIRKMLTKTPGALVKDTLNDINALKCVQLMFEK